MRRAMLGIPHDAPLSGATAVQPWRGSGNAQRRLPKTAQLLRQRYPDLEVVVPLVNAKRREQFEKF